MLSENLFCTIITSNYIHYALALRESLFEFGNADFQILVSDVKSGQKEEIESRYENTKLVYYTEICESGIGRAIYDKYYSIDTDAFRWAMKPVFMNYLISKEKYDKVIYLDCDIHFYNSWQFLFDYLNIYKILLTPHNRSLYPQNDPENFKKNFTEGIYNAGFIGINKDATEFINWFALACLFNCSKDVISGFYVDQKYLDIVPSRFEGVYSIPHLGCNVAGWNTIDCKRKIKNNQVFINEKFPIIFVHFSLETILTSSYGNDTLLKPYLKKYVDTIKKYNNNQNILDRILITKPVIKKRLFKRKLSKIIIRLKKLIKRTV